MKKEDISNTGYHEDHETVIGTDEVLERWLEIECVRELLKLEGRAS